MRAACGSPVAPAHRTRCHGRSGGGPQRAGSVGPNSTTDGIRSAVARCATPVSPQATRPADGDKPREAEQVVRRARASGAWRQAGARGDLPRERRLGRTAAQQHLAPTRALAACHFGPALRRPAARAARGAGMDQRRSVGIVRRRVGQREVERAGVGADPVVREQPAPAAHLVLALVPARAVGNVEPDQLLRRGGQQQPMALRPAPMQVDRQRPAREAGGEARVRRLARRPTPARRAARSRAPRAGRAAQAHAAPRGRGGDPEKQHRENAERGLP